MRELGRSTVGRQDRNTMEVSMDKRTTDAVHYDGLYHSVTAGHARVHEHERFDGRPDSFEADIHLNREDEGEVEVDTLRNGTVTVSFTQRNDQGQRCDTTLYLKDDAAVERLRNALDAYLERPEPEPTPWW